MLSVRARSSQTGYDSLGDSKTVSFAQACTLKNPTDGPRMLPVDSASAIVTASHRSGLLPRTFRRDSLSSMAIRPFPSSEYSIPSSSSRSMASRGSCARASSKSFRRIQYVSARRFANRFLSLLGFQPGISFHDPTARAKRIDAPAADAGRVDDQRE